MLHEQVESSLEINFKRGSAQPGCILALGGLRFRSTVIRFFKFVWCFRLQVLVQFFPEKRLELKTAKGWTKAEEEGPRCSSSFSGKNSGKTCSRKHHTNLKNRMAVLRNRYPLNIPPAGADPLLNILVALNLQDLESTHRAPSF